MGNQTKFRVIERKRKLITYQITDSEIDSLSALGRVEQVVLNACFTFFGSALGTLVTILSLEPPKVPVFVWVAFWVSIILTATLAIAFFCIMKALKSMKQDIREE